MNKKVEEETRKRDQRIAEIALMLYDENDPEQTIINIVRYIEDKFKEIKNEN